MAFDPKINRNEKDAIGDPGDPIATNTTEAWTSISLLKAIANKLLVGSGSTVSSDVAQGSTTAGETGGLQQAAVTTSAPTYNTGKTNPLSLKTNGDLRVADADAAALLTTIDSKLGDLKGYTDGLEALATSLNTYVDGLETINGAVNETAPATDTASSGLNGRLQRVAQRLTSLIALVPASLGAKAAASSFAVTASTEDAAQLGSLTETAPATDTASSGLNGRLQRVAQRLTSLIALLPTALGSTTSANSFAVTLSSDGPFSTLTGAVTETAPATDTASSGLNGRLQRIAQRLTSLIALVPASLGAKAAASSFAVTQSTEDAAQLGSLTETAPATDTASSGLNGRLQRIAQRLTSLIAAVGVAPIGITPTDRTIASMSGASQTLMAANASRHSMTIMNTGNANIGINPTGGTAVIAGAGTLTLVPGGAYSPRVPTLSAVTVIGTAGQPVYAEEN